MKPYLIYYLFSCIIFLGITNKNNAQIKEDSLVTEIDAILELDVAEEKYINSASKYDQTPEEAPSSISIITAKEIKAYGYQTITDLINAQRGFYYSNDRSGDYIGIRGFKRNFDHNNRILLLLDGHRLNSYQVDDAPFGHALSFNLSSFERVEIVRGPGSTLYGNNAVHGVINLITKKDRDSYLPVVNLQYGSFNSKYFGMRTSKKVTEDLSFSVQGNYYNSEGEDLYFQEFDNENNNNGISENNDGTTYNSVHLTVDYDDFKLTGMIRDYNKQLPTAPHNTEFNKEQSLFAKTEFIDLSWSPRVSYDKFLIFNLAYDHQKYGSNLPFVFLKDDFEFIGKNNSISADAQFIWDILPNNRIISGVEYRDNFSSSYNYSAGELEIIDDSWSYKLLSIFIQNEYQYNSNLSLFFGMRRDDFVGQEIAYNPRAGIVYSPFRNHTFKLLVGQGFRAPNLLERNLEEKNIVGFKKNELLKSEFINSHEFIWNYSISDDIKFNMSLFNYSMTNLIEQVEDPLDGLMQYVNSGEVAGNGIETEINYNFDIGSSYLRYSYQVVEDLSGSILTNSPEHLIKLGYSSRIFEPLHGSLECIYETKRKTIFGEYTDPILLANINVYTDTVLDYLTFSFTIKNLFNKTIKHPGGYELYQKSIIQPYRSYLFTVSFEL